MPPVDKAALEKAVADAAQYQEDEYTPETWAVFAKAYADAQAVLANEKATQDEVDAAVKALNEAVEGLAPAEQPEEANKVLLQKTYDYALTLSTEGVTDSARKFFEGRIGRSQSRSRQSQGHAAEVNTAWTNLLNGIWGLGIYTYIYSCWNS